MNYFITGTDTGVGKTLISCALLHAFAARGNTVAGMKPVAAGCAEDDINDDVKQLRAATNIFASLGQLNPYSFLHPIAPHLASRMEGVAINFERIIESYKELAAQAEVVIVEGVGGFMVPLNETQGSDDLAVALDLPVILVVGMRLGCINHALLTQQAILARNLNCAGWIANIIDADMPALQDNIEALKQRLQAPLLGIVPYQPQTDPRLAASQLDLSLLDGNSAII